MSITKARELRQERAKLAEEAKADVSANPDGFTSEEQARWDKRMERIDALEQEYRQIETNIERLARVEETLDERQELLDDVKQFGAKREEVRDQAEEYGEFFKDYLMGYRSREELRRHPHLRSEFALRHAADMAETRTIQGQTKGTAAQGGNLVPTELEASVQVALKAFGGMRSVARVVSTPTGANLDWPTSDDTANVAKIISEATAPSTTTRVPFGKITLEAVKYQSGPIKMSREIIQDGVIDIYSFVSNAAGTRFARAMNAHFTTRSSTESVGPHGITNDSTGAVAVANNALTPENLLSLQHSVDPAYRTGPSVAWMTNDAGVNEIRKLRWGSSRAFVWQPSLQPGTPDMLLGYPIVVNQDVPLEGTSGNKWLWFGNWSHYFIRDVAGIDMMRLEERYAEEGNIALLGFARADGRRVTGSTVIARRPYRAIVQSTG